MLEQTATGKAERKWRCAACWIEFPFSALVVVKEPYGNGFRCVSCQQQRNETVIDYQEPEVAPKPAKEADQHGKPRKHRPRSQPDGADD